MYLNSNRRATEFKQKVAALEYALRDIIGKLIFTKDIKARTIEWGMTATNRRGQIFLDMDAELHLAVTSVAQVAIYRRLVTENPFRT